jgi:uncharacterized protein
VSQIPGRITSGPPSYWVVGCGTVVTTLCTKLSTPGPLLWAPHPRLQIREPGPEPLLRGPDDVLVIAMLSIVVLLGLGLLVWTATRIVRQIRARQRLSLTCCLACGLGLASVDAIVCLALQVMGGLSHSQAAKHSADLWCLVSFIVLVVAPTAGLLVYRHVQVVAPKAESGASAAEGRRNWRHVLTSARADETMVKKLKMLAIVGLVAVTIVVSIQVVRYVPGPLLTYAARHGNTNLAVLLLDAGVSIDSRDRRGMTPLMHAAERGHTHMVRLLLDRGAKVSLARGEPYSALFSAIDSGRGDVVALLVERGADTNFQERYGNRPLPYAGQYGSVETVEALLNHGADINSVDDIGRTALMRASLCNRLELVDVLLRRGADTRVRDRDGSTALSLRWSGQGSPPDDRIVHLLIEYGAPQ